MTTSQTHSDTQQTANSAHTTSTDAEVSKQNPVDDKECGECGGVVIEDEKHGEQVCNDCGLVVSSDGIDHGPEWRGCDESSEQKRRVGAPVTNTLHDKGLSTDIDWRNQDANGNSLSSEKRAQVKRLRTWNKRCKTTDAKDRNLMRALSEISRMSSALGLNKGVEETASVLYRQCLNEDMLPGRSIEAMSSACLYAAARICNTPRSLHEMHPVSQVPASEHGDGPSELNRAYLYLIKELDLEIEPVDPRKYLNRILNEVDVAERESVRQTAVEILDVFEDENMHSGCSPVSLAAASVYSACGLHDQGVTQLAVVDAAGVCEVTIRNRYQEMIQLYQDRDEVRHEFNLRAP